MRRLLPAAILAVLLFALLVVPAGEAWTWPASGAVLQPFLFDPAHPYAAGQHRGIAVGGDPGATVLAAAAGTITFAGIVPSSGKSVTITTADGYAVTLTHLGSITVKKNAVVAEGDGVGTIADTGDADVPQPYVQLGVRIAAQPQGYLDPTTFLPARAAASATPVPPGVVVDPAPAPLPVADPEPKPVLASDPPPPASAGPAPAAPIEAAPQLPPVPVAMPAPKPAGPPPVEAPAPAAEVGATPALDPVRSAVAPAASVAKRTLVEARVVELPRAVGSLAAAPPAAEPRAAEPSVFKPGVVKSGVLEPAATQHPWPTAAGTPGREDVRVPPAGAAAAAAGAVTARDAPRRGAQLADSSPASRTGVFRAAHGRDGAAGGAPRRTGQRATRASRAAALALAATASPMWAIATRLAGHRGGAYLPVLVATLLLLAATLAR